MDEFHYLNAARVGLSTAYDDFDCTFKCLRNPFCLSINLAASKDANGKLWCELLSSDRYRNSLDYRENKTSHHLFLLVGSVLWYGNLTWLHFQNINNTAVASLVNASNNKRNKPKYRAAKIAKLGIALVKAKAPRNILYFEQKVICLWQEPLWLLILSYLFRLCVGTRWRNAEFGLFVNNPSLYNNSFSNGFFFSFLLLIAFPTYLQKKRHTFHAKCFTPESIASESEWILHHVWSTAIFNGK